MQEAATAFLFLLYVSLTRLTIQKILWKLYTSYRICKIDTLGQIPNINTIYSTVACTEYYILKNLRKITIKRQVAPLDTGIA